jgi:hypothetical protein
MKGRGCTASKQAVHVNNSLIHGLGPEEIHGRDFVSSAFSLVPSYYLGVGRKALSSASST